MNKLLEWLDEHISFCEHVGNGEAKAAFVLTRHYVNNLVSQDAAEYKECQHLWIKSFPLVTDDQGYQCMNCKAEKSVFKGEITENERRVYDAYRNAEDI